eukprot:15977-Prorocentrum_lima.AAC.1
MTSSLVGLGDVYKRQRSKRGRQAMEEFDLKGGQEGVEGGSRRAALLQTPVSYTHLTLPTICSV